MIEEALKLQVESYKQALNDALLRATLAEDFANKKIEALAEPQKITEYIVSTIRGDAETLTQSRLVAHENLLASTVLAIDALLLSPDVDLRANLVEIQKSLKLSSK